MSSNTIRLCTYWLLLIVAKAAVNDQFYPRYHLAPPHGWMNDPNGFSKFRGEYHLFYQYNPLSSFEPGIAHWGHAKSKDLFHWEHLPIAMYPNNTYDKSGVFSGSTIIVNDTMYIYYTGNVNHPGETPDHEQRQALATSTDGITVTKFEHNPIITADDRQPNIRDPKVWRHGEDFYMVLGNSFNSDTLGRVLLYKSDDLVNWKEVAILAESNGTLGFMWECPDFFEINGKFVLLFSPQGVQPQGDKYKNLYQTGYIVGDFDYATNKFTPLTEFRELDHGHDFYATQTILDNYGRRLLVAWFDMWEQDYPERADGWTGQMTIVRELRLTRHNILKQAPIREVNLSYGSLFKNIRGRTLYNGRNGYQAVKLQDKSGEINIKGERSRDLEVVIESDDNNAKVSIKYDHKAGTVTLDRGGNDGVRRTNWRPLEPTFRWRIYVDASSVELFCGKGEITFSSRFFPTSAVNVRIAAPTRVHNLAVTSLKRAIVLPSFEE